MSKLDSTLAAIREHMTELNQIYKCNVCGNMVEVIHNGAGELVCCGQPMELKIENPPAGGEEEGKEKHVPVVEKTSDGAIVKIGSIPHPMENEHYIEWIEMITEQGIHRKKLKPGDAPEAEFFLEAEPIKIRAYCNVHGLWKS